MWRSDEVPRPQAQRGVAERGPTSTVDRCSAAASSTAPEAVIQCRCGCGDRKNGSAPCDVCDLLDVGEPHLPLLEQLGRLSRRAVEHADAVVPDDQLDRGRRAAGAHLQHRHHQLPTLERRVDRRQERDQQGDEAEPDRPPRRWRRRRSGRSRRRREPERRERRPARDERLAERVDAQPPEHERERQDHAQRPRRGEQHETHRSEQGHDPVALVVGALVPGEHVEDLAQADEHRPGERHDLRPRQHDGADRRAQHPERDEQPEHDRQRPSHSDHRRSLRRLARGAISSGHPRRVRATIVP